MHARGIFHIDGYDQIRLRLHFESALCFFIEAAFHRVMLGEDREKARKGRIAVVQLFPNVLGHFGRLTAPCNVMQAQHRGKDSPHSSVVCFSLKFLYRADSQGSFP